MADMSCLVCGKKEWDYDIVTNAGKFCGDHWFLFNKVFYTICSREARVTRSEGKPMSWVLFRKVLNKARREYHGQLVERTR